MFLRTIMLIVKIKIEQQGWTSSYIHKDLKKCMYIKHSHSKHFLKNLASSRTKQFFKYRLN